MASKKRVYPKIFLSLSFSLLPYTHPFLTLILYLTHSLTHSLTYTHTHSPLLHLAQPLFKHSICKATHWSETFIATDSMSVLKMKVQQTIQTNLIRSSILRFPLTPEWLPALNVVNRKAVDHDITEPMAPVLIERSIILIERQSR